MTRSWSCRLSKTHLMSVTSRSDLYIALYNQEVLSSWMVYFIVQLSSLGVSSLKSGHVWSIYVYIIRVLIVRLLRCVPPVCFNSALMLYMCVHHHRMPWAAPCWITQKPLLCWCADMGTMCGVPRGRRQRPCEWKRVIPEGAGPG